MKRLADGTKLAETDTDFESLSRAEDELVLQYRNAYFLYNEVATKVTAHFMALIKLVKSREEGMALVRRCPDDVTKAFMLDHLSHVKGFTQ